jgi:hypothetical protein
MVKVIKQKERKMGIIKKVIGYIKNRLQVRYLLKPSTDWNVEAEKRENAKVR